MSSELADLVPTTTSKTLAARVREAVSQLINGGTIAVDSHADDHDLLTLSDQGRRLVVVDAAALTRPGTRIEELVAQAVRGDLALLAVGDIPGEIQSLLGRGVYDVVEANASGARLMLAIRNALQMLELKDRADDRARWLRRFQYEAATLIETTRALSQERDIHKLLAMILQKCRFIAGADAGSIYVVEGHDPDIEKRQLRFKLSQNESVAFPSSEFVMPISRRSIAGSVAITRDVVALDDVYNLPPDSGLAFDRSFDQKVGYRTKSMLTVPLVSAEDNVIGVVQLINKKRDPRARLRAPQDAESAVVPFDERSKELIGSLAAQAGLALENAMLYEEIRRIFEGFVRASVQAIEQRDPTTSGHSQRVSTLSCRIAQAVDHIDAGPYKDTKFTRQDLRELEYASLLHDFGKIGVREQVLVKAKKLYDPQLRLIRLRFDFLRKSVEAEVAARRAELYARNAPVSELQSLEDEISVRIGQLEAAWDVIRESNEPTVLPHGTFERIDEIAARVYIDPRGITNPWLLDDEKISLKIPRGSLTPQEFDEIRSHVSHTFEFLSRIPWGKTFANVPIIAGCHHEKLNGRGYPRGLRANDIPVGSRIMAIADIFDALTASDRPYKKAVPVDRALGILDMEVKDGGLDGELVRIFVESGVYRVVDGELVY